MTKTLICVVGPTAIGKTALGIFLAQHFNTEVVSADSRQFYKEMNIGTAVPTLEELTQVKHHFIQHISISDHYSVGNFEKDALNTLSTLFKHKDIVVMVGGSGLYVDAVTKGLDNFPKVDKKIRVKLNEQLQNQGIEALQRQLKELDAEYFEKVDLHNPHRIIRALEICIGTQMPYSSFLKDDTVQRPFNSIYIGLEADRQLVYDRINKRVDIMFNTGLLEEAKSLYPYKDLNALNTVGYKELFEYLDNTITLEEAVEKIKRNTRRFAKRQLTWYRKKDDITWFARDTPKADIIKVIDNKLH